MQLSELLSKDSIACDVDAQSKKRALQELSELIAEKDKNVSTNEVFDSLINRERLGGTGIGHGAAIPHGRLKNCKHITGAFIRLKNAIDFDSVDNTPVDLLFALIVPEESNDEHLKVLAMLASMFNDEEFRNKLRSSNTCDGMQQLLSEWQQTH